VRRVSAGKKGAMASRSTLDSRNPEAGITGITGGTIR